MDSDETDSKRILKDCKKLILSSNTEDIVKGLKNLKKIIIKDRNNVWAFIYYGVGASKCAKHKHETLPAFETAVTIAPDTVEAWKGMRSYLEVMDRSENEDELLIKCYTHLLRLECDPSKWNSAYDSMKSYLAKYSVPLLARFLANQLEDFTSKSYKHENACKDLSFLSFSNESLFETNIDHVILGFQCRANFLDFMDRPEFCVKVCAYLTKLNKFKALSDFLYHTITIYGPELYLKIVLAEYLINIAFDSMDHVEKLIPLIGPVLKKIEDVKLFPQLKLGLCIIHFFEDFTRARETLENLSFSGDVQASLFLLKLLCKIKDYESVVFLSLKFAKLFAGVGSIKIKEEFLSCLLEALSCSNDVTFLEYGIKLNLKSLSKNNENASVLFNLCQSYLALNDPKALFYLDKLTPEHSDDIKYLNALLKRKSSEFESDSNKWLLSLLLSANYDLISNNIKRALKTFTKIGTKDKCLSEPFVILGADSNSKGSIERAAACFHWAFVLRPLDADVLKCYLDVLFKLNDEQRALKVLDSVWEGHFGKWHQIGEKSLFASGLIHSAKGQHEKSIKSLKHLIKIYDDNLDFIEVIADEYIRLGRLGIAENYISRLVFQDPYNLHSLVLLAEIYKLDVNYSSYFNLGVKCLNFKASESSECDKDIKIILCVFINFLKSSKLEESSCSYISKLCENSLNRIFHIVSTGATERSTDNEFLIALYIFIETHFIGALKLSRQKENLSEVIKLMSFCIAALSKTLTVYGSCHISFWKLLGDVLLNSSQLSCDFYVNSWLIDDNVTCKFTKVSDVDQIFLAIKCYVTGLKLSEKKSESRITEFYYDISVALVHLANHQKINDPEFRFGCLKSSLAFCLKSFIFSDGFIEKRWIHSNLLGVIASQLGVKDNLFKQHFSKPELEITEGIMLQNYAAHLAKAGLFSHAEEVFEQARLQTDMDYTFSWVGQLLMQLINKDVETEKMLQYNLTQIGDHRLFKWILAYYFISNRHRFELHGGHYNILMKAFPESDCLFESNPYKISLLAYVHETLGNIAIARRLYFRALRFSKFVDDETCHFFIENAIRLNSHCHQNFDLLKLLDFEFSPVASISLYSLTSFHISLPKANRYTLFKSVLALKNILNSISCNENVIQLSLPVLLNLSDIKLSKFVKSNIPYILNYIFKHISSMSKCPKRDFKLFLSSLDPTIRLSYLKQMLNVLSIRNIKSLDSGSTCLTSDISLLKLVKRSVGEVTISKNFEISSLGIEDNNVSDESEMSLVDTSTKTNSITPYSKVLNNLRSTIFPLQLSDEERLALKHDKILKLQSQNTQSSEKFVVKFNDNSYLKTMESHGCHFNCSIVLHLLKKNYNKKDFMNLSKYAFISLNIRCNSCLTGNEILPLICFVCLKTSDVRLIQKASHLYPQNNLIQKTLLCFLSKSN